MLRFFQPSLKRQEVIHLYEQVYDSESESNFRFIFFLLATKSKYILTEADRVDDESIYAFLSDIGQYAEIAHGSISPSFVFQNIAELCQSGFPLADYKALRDDKAILIQSFKGTVANVQGYVALRPHSGQLVIAFSGTSNLSQALKDVQACKVAYPRDETSSSRVHFGFWSMYCGIKSKAMKALQLAFKEHFGRISSVVLTGHSMGATLSYFLALDLMADFRPGTTISHDAIPSGIPLTLVAFGSPRLGDNGLAQFWRDCVHHYRRRFGQESFREYAIKAFNDGVHVVPLYLMGYRHLTDSPLYLYHGHLYQIPRTQCEHGLFTVVESENVSEPSHSHEMQRLTASVNQHATTSASASNFERLIWPRGGHNYYFRDMENLQRRIKWLELEIHGEHNWRERYKLRLKMWEAKWGHPVVQVQAKIANAERPIGHHQE